MPRQQLALIGNYTIIWYEMLSTEDRNKLLVADKEIALERVINEVN